MGGPPSSTGPGKRTRAGSGMDGQVLKVPTATLGQSFQPQSTPDESAPNQPAALQHPQR